MKIAFVIPVFNEAPNIDYLFDQFGSLWAEPNNRVIFVNDGSSDDTLENILKKKENNPSISIISLSRNFGKDQALAAGLSHVQDEAVLVMDGDGQHSIDAVTNLLKASDNNIDGDIFFGVRENRHYQSLLQRGYSGLLYRLLNFGKKRYKIEKNIGDFFLARSKVVKILRQYNNHRPFWKGFYGYIGFERVDVPVTIDERFAGNTKFKYRHQFSLAADSLVANVKWPLRLIFFVGTFVSLYSAIYLSYVLGYYLVTRETSDGYYTLLSLQLLFGGMTLISLGVIAEYVGMILDQVKGTPSYIIEKIYD